MSILLTFLSFQICWLDPCHKPWLAKETGLFLGNQTPCAETTERRVNKLWQFALIWLYQLLMNHTPKVNWWVVRQKIRLPISKHGMCVGRWHSLAQCHTVHVSLGAQECQPLVIWNQTRQVFFYHAFLLWTRMYIRDHAESFWKTDTSKSIIKVQLSPCSPTRKTFMQEILETF